jgi:hypothetical protein
VTTATGGIQLRRIVIAPMRTACVAARCAAARWGVLKNSVGAELVATRCAGATCVRITGKESVGRVSASSACVRAGDATKKDDAIGAA